MLCHLVECRSIPRASARSPHQAKLRERNRCAETRRHAEGARTEACRDANSGNSAVTQTVRFATEIAQFVLARA
jgi:hypothetical protein